LKPEETKAKAETGAEPAVFSGSVVSVGFAARQPVSLTLGSVFSGGLGSDERRMQNDEWQKGLYSGRLPPLVGWLANQGNLPGRKEINFRGLKDET
jgi:hypothetical protein